MSGCAARDANYGGTGCTPITTKLTRRPAARPFTQAHNSGVVGVRNQNALRPPHKHLVRRVTVLPCATLVRPREHRPPTRPSRTCLPTHPHPPSPASLGTHTTLPVCPHSSGAVDACANDPRRRHGRGRAVAAATSSSLGVWRRQGVRPHGGRQRATATWTPRCSRRLGRHLCCGARMWSCRLARRRSWASVETPTPPRTSMARRTAGEVAGQIAMPRLRTCW